MADFERKSAINDELYGGHGPDELCSAGSDTFRLFRNLDHSVIEDDNLAATDYIASEVILVCISRKFDHPLAGSAAPAGVNG